MWHSVFSLFPKNTYMSIYMYIYVLLYLCMYIYVCIYLYSYFFHPIYAQWKNKNFHFGNCCLGKKKKGDTKELRESVKKIF